MRSFSDPPRARPLGRPVRPMRPSRSLGDLGATVVVFVQVVATLWRPDPRLADVGAGRVCEQVFDRDTDRVPMSVEQIENLRRSSAMGPPESQVAELLETAAESPATMREIAKVLHALGSRWPGVRAALNELNKLTR